MMSHYDYDNSAIMKALTGQELCEERMVYEILFDWGTTAGLEKYDLSSVEVRLSERSNQVESSVSKVMTPPSHKVRSIFMFC